MKVRFVFVILAFLILPLTLGAEVPYDGLVLKWDTETTSTIDNLPSFMEENEGEFAYSYEMLSSEQAKQTNVETDEIAILDITNRRFLEGDSEGLFTSHWIPKDLSYGDEITIHNFSYKVNDLSDSVLVDDFGSIEAIKVRSTDSFKTEDGIEIEDELLAWYDKESRIKVKEKVIRTVYMGSLSGTKITINQIAETNVDSDSDGLTDMQELLKHNTNPTSKDTDEDGLSDKVEISGKTEVLNPDTDQDGLLDGAEVDLGTNPLKEDSDSDGLLDGEEVEKGTNPLSKDSDNDGVSDREEIDEGTNPVEEDSDGDLWNDNIDFSPRSFLLPNGLLLLVVLAGLVIFKVVKIDVE